MNYTFNHFEIPGSYTLLTGINDQGQVVGSTEDLFETGIVRSFIYSDGEITYLDTDFLRLTGINDEGDLVGWGTEPWQWPGVLYDGEDFTQLSSVIPADINDSGYIVGGRVLYDGADYLILDVPSSRQFSTRAEGINDSGQVVGSYGASDVDDDYPHGFVYENGTYTTLDHPLGARGTYLEDVNDNGEIVGWYVGSDFVVHGFIYSNGTFTTLQYPEFTFQISIATVGYFTPHLSINDDGTIVGYQGNVDADLLFTSAFIATRVLDTDNVAPTLVSALPADDAINVAADANIVLTFDEEVTAGSGNIEIRDGAGNVVETIAVSEATISDNVVTIDPENDLASGSRYHLYIPAGAFEDLAGNAFAGVTSDTALDFKTIGATPLYVYPIWNSDGTPQTQITQGNDDPYSHHDQLRWAYDFRTLDERGRSTTGLDVHAVAGGTIVAWYDAWQPEDGVSYGNIVTVLTDDGFHVTYGHLSSILIREGRVEAGQVIALSGDTGTYSSRKEDFDHAPNPHLHVQFGTDAYPSEVQAEGALVADGRSDPLTAPAFFPELEFRLGNDDRMYNGAEGIDIAIGNGLNNAINGFAGNDLLRGGSGSDTLDGGAGADRFVFAEAGPKDRDFILDYSYADGDVIVLSELLDKEFGPTSNVANFVRLQITGNDVIVQIDTNGEKGGLKWTDVAVLDDYATGFNDYVRLFFGGQEHTLFI